MMMMLCIASFTKASRSVDCWQSDNKSSQQQKKNLEESLVLRQRLKGSVYIRPSSCKFNKMTDKPLWSLSQSSLVWEHTVPRSRAKESHRLRTWFFCKASHRPISEDVSPDLSSGRLLDCAIIVWTQSATASGARYCITPGWSACLKFLVRVGNLKLLILSHYYLRCFLLNTLQFIYISKWKYAIYGIKKFVVTCYLLD